MRSVPLPTEATLARVVPSDLHADRPFTRRLALGEPQLAFAAFDLAVLETYRNDPRYVFRAGDAGGMISISDEHYQSPEMPDRDQVLLQSFGFCYGPNKERAVEHTRSGKNSRRSCKPASNPGATLKVVAQVTDCGRRLSDPEECVDV